MKNLYKLWIALSFLIVFTAGTLGGIYLERRLLHPKANRDAAKARDSRRRTTVHFPTLNDMAAELGLSQQQKEQIQAVFDNNEDRLSSYNKEVHGQFRTMRTQLLDEIKTVLSSEQAEKFDAMINKYLEQRKLEYEKRRQRRPEEKQQQGERQ